MLLFDMLLQLQKRCLIYLSGIAFLLVANNSLLAQPTTAAFKVIHLPRKTGYGKEKLNAELAKLTDKEAVKKLLRAKNFPAETYIVLHIARANNKSAYWTINTSSPTDKEDDRIILQSRDNTTTKFFKLAEFKSFFKDTLAIIDTLRIELFIKDEDYPDDQFMLSSICGKTKSKKKIPLENDKLIFTNELVSNCKGGLPPVTIYNNNNPVRVLASCKINFLTVEQKETLLSMAAFTNAEEPYKDLKDISLLLYGYCLNNFGRLHFPQLLNWLENNNAAIKHGDNR